MTLERPKAKVTFHYKFSNHFSGDMKWRVRMFIDGFHVGCLWCTEIKEDILHLSICFYGPDNRVLMTFYFLDYDLVEDD